MLSRLFFLIVMAFELLVYSRAGNGGERTGLEQRGPWFVQQSQTGQTGAPEYFAITRSLENSALWMGVSCVDDKRIYLSILKNDIEFPDVATTPFSLIIRFDSNSMLSIEAKYVNAHLLAVDPFTSKRILVALIHSRVIEITMPEIAGGEVGSFSVQPYAPALNEIIDACAVGETRPPAGSL